MATESVLFHAYDPLIRYDPVYVCRDKLDTQYILSIRPVWIISDLELLHDWFDSPQKISNWTFDQRRYTLFQHYKDLLMSLKAQSFIIDQNNKPIIQIDILSKNIASSSPFVTSPGRFYLYFLYKENFRDQDSGNFKKGLQCMISFLFSFVEVNSVFVQLSDPDHMQSLLLIDSGFEPSAQETPGKGKLFVYNRK